jgi:membrane protein DedA with SNARE-associated domain
MSEIPQFLMGHGGPVLFAIVFAEQAGLPLPSAPWLLAAGALSAGGRLNPVVAIGVTALAALLADSIWFYVGRRGGQRVLRLFCSLSLARNSCVGRTKDFFARHGLQTMVASKFLPGLGAVMPPLAGALGMPVSRFLLYDGLGSLFYGSFYVLAGFLFHNQLEQAVSMMSQLGFSVLLLALALVTGYIAFKYARRLTSVCRVSRRDDIEDHKAAVVDEDPRGGTGDANHGATGFLAGGLNTLELQDVALAVTSSPAQRVIASAVTPIVSNAP